MTNLDRWVLEIDTALKETDTGEDITTCRAFHLKHKRMEKDVATKKQRMIDLSAKPDEVDEEKIIEEKRIMEERYVYMLSITVWFVRF